MKSIEVNLRQPARFHARPAGTLSKEAQKFESDITIAANGREVDAKRATSLMLLGACSKVVIVANGTDEEAAVEAVKATLMTVSGW